MTNHTNSIDPTEARVLRRKIRLEILLACLEPTKAVETTATPLVSPSPPVYAKAVIPLPRVRPAPPASFAPKAWLDPLATTVFLA